MQPMFISGVRVELERGSDWLGRDVYFAIIAGERRSFWDWDDLDAGKWIAETVEEHRALNRRRTH